MTVSPGSRVRWQVILIHKWTRSTIGVVGGMWLVTGAFLVMPTLSLLPPASITYEV